MQPCRPEELIEEKKKTTKLGFGEVADKEDVIIEFDWMCILQVCKLIFVVQANKP
jgi:hypothetical protein